ncbi:MAG: flagellar hook-associated protein FlgK [Pseudomonadota bacterium]
MSLTSSLYTALTGLQTNQSAMRVLSNNVANVNTPGYTRKIADLQSRVIAGTGAGVELGSVRRYVDDALFSQLRSTTSDFSGLDVRQQLFKRMQDMFGSPDSNSSLGAALSDFSTSVTALTTNPESVSLRLDVITNAQRAAQRFNAMAADTQQLRQEADSQIADAIEIVNGQLAAIDKLNSQIVAAKLRGVETGDLEDQRDQALSKISEQMDVSTYVRENGQMVVFTKSGRTLLDNDPATISHTPAASLQAAVTYPGGIDGIDVNGVDITGEIGSGKIAALVELRDKTLPNFAAEINQLATQLRDEVNRIHNQGTGLPAATTLASSRPQTGTATSLTGTVTVTLLNSDGTAAFSGTMPAPGTLDAAGFAAALNTVLAGFGVGASAAASGGTVTLDGGGYGVAITGGTVDPGGGQPTTNLSDFLHLNDLFVGNDPTGVDLASVLQVRSDIAADPSLLSRGALQQDASLNWYVGAGDSQIVSALAAKLTSSVSFPATGDLPASSTSFADYAANILSQNATAAAQADNDYAFTQALKQQLENRVGSESGVNTDEELSNMVVLQNAYAASGRIVSAVNQMFDVLLQLGQ